MKVPVLWCSHHDDVLARGYADQGLLEAVLDRTLWRPPDAIEFVHHEIRGNHPALEDGGGAVVIFNGRTHTSSEDVAWLQGILDRFDWSVVLICGDEEWDFDWRALQGERRHLWAMQARPEHQAAGLGALPGGWYPGTRELLAEQHLDWRYFDERLVPWFFAGQVTHKRRQECAAMLRKLGRRVQGKLIETDHYLAEGIPRETYFAWMAQAKVIPSPSGPYSVDCARTFEALEAGCIPVADLKSTYGPEFDYWALLFGADAPVPKIREWTSFPRMLRSLLVNWQAKANTTFAWWQQWKRQLALDLDADIRRMAGVPADLWAPDDAITAVITTSPVPRHPSTDHIEQVVESIREQLPLAEIVIVADGIRPEMEHRRDAYETYLQRLLWLTNHRWRNVVPVLLPEWGHQANAMRAALELVATPLVLFAEHDCPLVGEIDWPGLCGLIYSGDANLIRFHEDPELNPDHGDVIGHRQLVDGVPLRKTVAWWQRPHLASSAFYRERVMPFFHPDSRTMIEDLMYPTIVNQWADKGDEVWDWWRMWVYAPEGGEFGMRRSGHLDSRGSDPKYDMRFRP